MRIINSGIPIVAAIVISAAPAQNLAGTITTADTSAILAGATVVAVEKASSPGMRPIILRSTVDSLGHYAITAPPGQYAVCVHPMPQSPYMDPCQWGDPVTVTVSATAVSVVPISLQKGSRFIVRVHDTKQVLAQAETVKGSAICVFVTAPSKEPAVPVVYSDGIVRDYGTVVPINVPLSVTVSSNHVALADRNGTVLAPSPIFFEVLPTDIASTEGRFSPLIRMFPLPDTTIIHVYTTGLKKLLLRGTS
jgi:hypothetical protein